MRSEGIQPVLVFCEQNRTAGLAVDEIVDIVEDHLDIRATGQSPGVVGSAIIHGQATEIVDVGHYLSLAIPGWFAGAGGPAPRQARVRRVLLVDAAPFFRGLLVPVLKAAGFDVLALAEVEQMRRLSDVEDVDLTALTRDLLHTLEPRLRQKNLQVVDQQTLGTMLQGNRFLLSQSLRNLLDNAIDFSPDGGTLMITSTLQAGRIQWQLRDAGPGIPDYAIGRIFERFYSLPRGEGQERSSGLGLCLVREVCDLHGGTIEVVNVGGAQHDASGCEAQLKLPAQQHRR
jgi:hypothetical protein